MICSRCKEDLPRDRFRKRAASKSGLQNMCAKCNTEYVRWLYQNCYVRREKEKARNRARRAKKRAQSSQSIPVTS